MTNMHDQDRLLADDQDRLLADNHSRHSADDYSIQEFAAHMEMLPEELENLFRTFIEEFDSELSALKSANIANDYKRMCSIAHNIKGIAANMEMDALFQSCKTLNDVLKAIDANDPPNANHADRDNTSTLHHLTLMHDIECQYDQVKGILLDFYHNL